MWENRRRIERLEGLMQSVAEGHKALAEALAKLTPGAPSGAPSSGASDVAMTALGQMITNMSEALRASQEGQQKLMDGLLNRAAKTVHRSLGQELAERSKVVRAERKELLRGLPAWVATCEECLALVQKRAPEHTDHLSRHTLEHHAEQLAVFVKQVDLPLRAADHEWVR